MASCLSQGPHLNSAATPTGPMMAEKKADLEYLLG